MRHKNLRLFESTRKPIHRFTGTTTTRSLTSRSREGLLPCADCEAVILEMNARRAAAGIGARGFATVGANLRDLHRRHLEHGRAACLDVVRIKAAEWLHGPKADDMAIYFRPSTLFRPCHFLEYLAQPDPDAPQLKIDQWGRLPDGTYPGDKT